MRRPCSILALILLLALGAYVAVPAEDVPETPYDESEGLPYESAPLFSGVVPQTSARMATAELSSDSLPRFNSLTKRCKRCRESNAGSHWGPDSLIILNHSLRC